MPKVLATMPAQQTVIQAAIEAAPATQPADGKPPANLAAPKLKKNGEARNGPTHLNNRLIVYPTISINGVEIPRANLKITVKAAKDMLGWETEQDYAERRTKEPKERGGGLDKIHYKFRSPNSDDPMLAKAPECHFTAPDGHKVICWRNANNRPLDEGWVDRLAQDVLTRNFLLNLETIIISKTRLVQSGQHRLIALVWASIIWGGANADHWRIAWPEEPHIESLVACGADESPEVLMTLDNTKARTEADNFVTSDLIDWTTKSTAKRECSKYLQEAVNTLWKRTGAEGAGSFARYRTHSVAMDFVRKHPTLLRCVRHIYEENSSDGRAISGLGLSPGQCSAMLYLAGSCESDGDQYRHHATAAERSEDGLDWGMLDKAKQFFSLLAASDPDVDPAHANRAAQAAMKPVRHALGLIRDPEEGAGGSRAEQQAILAKAWTVFAKGHQLEDTDLVLTYGQLLDSAGDAKKRWLNECPIFGGIDVGVPVKSDKAGAGAPSIPRPKAGDAAKAAKAAAAAKDAEIRKRIEESKERIKPTQAEKVRADIAAHKAANPGKLLIFRLDSGSYAAFGSDAMVLGKTIGVEVNDNVDPVKLAISKADAAEHLAAIAAAHDNAVTVTKLAQPNGQPPKIVVEPLEPQTIAPVAESAPVQGALS